jgi:hypothetical protein
MTTKRELKKALAACLRAMKDGRPAFVDTKSMNRWDRAINRADQIINPQDWYDAGEMPSGSVNRGTDMEGRMPY